MKLCAKCKQLKSFDQFTITKQRSKVYYKSYCKECSVLAAKEWRLKNVERRKEYNKKYAKRKREWHKEYRRTHKAETYLRHLKSKGFDIDNLPINNGTCYICHKFENRLHLDHDHKTGRVRGWLCHHCNVSLVSALENPLINLAKEYLNKYSEIKVQEE